MRKDKRKKAGLGLRTTGMILCVGLSTAIFISTYGSAGGAEKYPTRPVDIIVPYAPGASTDYLARFYAIELSKRWGQPVNVINKVGGSGVVGTQFAVSAPPDGYTMLMDGPASSSGQMGIKGLPFDVLNRTFIAMAGEVPMFILLATSCPWNTMQELAEAGRKDPASMVWGAASGGRGAADITLLQFFDVAGIDVPKTRRVDFTGTGTAINALAGNHIKLVGGSTGSITAVLASGKAKAICVTAPKRLSLLPEVPTTREAGFPKVDYKTWKGFSGPPGLPTYVKEVFAKTVEEIMKDPEVIDKLEKRYESLPTFLAGEAFKTFVRDEGHNIERLVKLMAGGK